MRTIHVGVIALVLAGWLFVGPATRARGSAAPTAAGADRAAAPHSPDKGPASDQSFFEILRAGGVIGLLILLLSIAAVALVIEHVMTIRASVLMPEGLPEEVHQLLAAGKVGQAGQRCRMQPSLLAHVLGAGLAEAEGGWPAVEKATEDATAEQSARLFRKIEYLSVIGNIAPMMGLLGTVIGMILAFREVADTQGAARAADLAEGIYLALVTTVEGLIVAIPSLAAFAVFRNRVDQLVAEAAYVAQHVFAPLKRAQPSGPPRRPGPPKPPSPPTTGGGS
ncbi:MAG: MotA/TolQ/ExbB proton channel family protein [Planctomycetota bacterium]